MNDDAPCCVPGSQPTDCVLADDADDAADDDGDCLVLPDLELSKLLQAFPPSFFGDASKACHRGILAGDQVVPDIEQT